MPRDLPSPSGASSDPFLAQTRNLPLSDRERQEGYDMDLVHSRPRGQKGAMGSQPSPSAVGGSAAGLGAGAGAYEMTQSRPSLASGGRSYSNNVNGGLTGPGTAVGLGSGEKYGDSTSRGIAAADEPPTQRKWFLRTPAVIVLGLLLLLAFALAIGLGVGLGVARRKSSSNATKSNSTSTSTTTHASGATTGTVIPSSLSSLFTTPRLSSSSSVSTTVLSSATSSAVAASGITRFTSPLVSPTSQFVSSEADATVAGALSTATSIATAKATTGNLPIPAGDSTTIIDASGTHTISALSAVAVAEETTMRRVRR